MKAIRITENNIKEVYGRLRKFFYNNNRTGFIFWDNLDCGFKKHIKSFRSTKSYRSTIKDYNFEIPIYSKLPSPDSVDFVQNNEQPEMNHIFIRFTDMEFEYLEIGDKIAFCSNKIIIKSEWLEKRVMYKVYQATPMTDEEQHNLKVLAKQEHEFYKNDFYDYD